MIGLASLPLLVYILVEGARTAVLRWDEIASVTTTTVGGGRFRHGGTRKVTYTLTQGGRERLEHECAAAGLAPPSWWARQPGAILMKHSYVLAPRRLAELLGTAQRRYSRHVSVG